jgi:hypothetical protein
MRRRQQQTYRRVKSERPERLVRPDYEPAAYRNLKAAAIPELQRRLGGLFCGELTRGGPRIRKRK